ncbi:MAG: glycosyltransferase family 4 protein [Candidatus Woesearchaeota archaeon]
MKIRFIKRKSFTGGESYEKILEDVLRKHYDFNSTAINIKTKLNNRNNLLYNIKRIVPRLYLACKLIFIKKGDDIVIRDFFGAAFLACNYKASKVNVVLVHHIDKTVLTHKWMYGLLEFMFYRNLKYADYIVTVSQTWKKIFENRGFHNVRVIENAFDISDFSITDTEVSKFKRKYGLHDKPVIYLGNCQEAKGVKEAFEALKDLNVYLVTSGKQWVNIPAQNLDLPYRDYLTLLKSSTIVLTMSKFNEGWCRTAHEAMLLGTPVIGSGRGGMHDLLTGGGQIICNFDDLKEKVELLLSKKYLYEKHSRQGQRFAKKFDLKRFESRWINFIESIY